jgi:PAS domain S-box-containing protein
MLLEKIPNIAVQAYGADGTVQYWNKASERIYGYTEAEAVGKTLFDLIIPEEAQQEVRENVAAAVSSGIDIPAGELMLRHKDGSYVAVFSSHVVIRAPGEEPQLFCIDIDITDRKLAESALLESEERYRAVIEQAPEAVYICNPDTGEILETNSRFTALFGYELGRDGPMSVFDLAVDRRENIAEYLTKAKADGFLPLQRLVVRHKNGAYIQVERATTLVCCRERSLLVHTMRDVSEDVRREQELQRDAELATRVQTTLLKQATASVHLDIATVYAPSSYVGGDLYFMDWRYDGNMLRGYLIDAAGHGLATALHTSAMHVLLREINDLDLPLPEQMHWLNQRAGQYFDEATFAGAVGFELDLQLRKLCWCCAGMPLIWLSTRDQHGIVNCPGMYLGICSAETFEMHTTPIAVGDSVCFMTDGLSEIIGLHDEIQQLGYADMVSLLQKIALSGECRDDATAVCIQVKSLPDLSVRVDGWPRNLHFNGYGDYQRLKGELGKILTELTGKEHSMQEVAVHEALANAMECRDGVPRQHRARLRFNKVGRWLIVRVKTSRIGFAGNAILRRLRSQPGDMFSFGEDASMGRGIPMMLSVSHKMTYNSEGTEVLLAWRL